jgi:hypothetical protein
MLHAIFYMIISANFLTQLFPCKMQQLLVQNMLR